MKAHQHRKQIKRKCVPYVLKSLSNTGPALTDAQRDTLMTFYNPPLVLNFMNAIYDMNF